MPVGFVVGTCGMGLTPPTPSSVEPIGIPARPVAVEIEPVGEDADAAGLPAGLAARPAQVLDAIAAVPPPSKSELDVLKSEPDPLLGTPFTPPVEFPAGELVPEHAVLLLLDGLIDDIPEGPGLIPKGPSPGVPRGIPVPEIAAGATGLMPSGEVIPSGDGALVPIWACAEPHRKTAAIAWIKMRVMAATSPDFSGPN